MPIEFDCTQCGQRLRTPDDTAGKQAQCPGCNSLIPIPVQSEPLGRQVDRDDLAPGMPESAGQSAPSPFADPPLVNPYQGPVGPTDQAALSPAEAHGKLVGPAVGLMVGAVMSLLPVLFFGVNLVVTFDVFVDQVGAELANDPAAQATVPFVVGVFLFLFLVVPVVVIVAVIAGAVAMLRVRRYGLAKTGAILALIPCYCCYPVGLAFGIWGLMVLNDVNVRAAFRSASG